MHKDEFLNTLNCAFSEAVVRRRSRTWHFVDDVVFGHRQDAESMKIEGGSSSNVNAAVEKSRAEAEEEEQEQEDEEET